MSFVKFEEGGGRSIGNSVSISKAGQLTITVNFRKYFKDLNFCELYYDKEKQLIGVVPIPAATITSRRVRAWSGSDRGSFISMTGFLRYHDLPCGKGRAIYSATWDEATKMLVISMSTATEPKEAA